ncbi:hypothetical protein NPX13_g7946 [Xylaria arbuscula]|uniref:Uncharacterized protein n=1 Tax=Xylaria arbuscula TaxID=114810 RepID=A0A9W8N929_9PEZI|nr:hypothetical protein NPX13_g7946 [Xylaria arbuscula]
MAPPQLSGRSTTSESETLGGTPAPTRVSSHKRHKKPHEYSTNPNTVRARRRISRLTPYHREVERAKQNDTKAVSAKWKACAKSPSFQAASEAIKNRVLATVEQEIMAERRRKGIDYDSKVVKLNKKYNIVEPCPTTNKAAHKPARQLAPPALVSASKEAHPTNVEDDSQETPTPAPGAHDTSNSAPAKTAEPTPVSPVISEASTASTASTVLQDLSSAIKILKEVQEAQNAETIQQKREAEFLKQRMQAMEVTIQSLGEKVDKLSIANPAPTPAPAPQMQMQMQPYPQAQFAMAPPFPHPHLQARPHMPLEQHSHHYHFLFQDQDPHQGYQLPQFEQNGDAGNDPENHGAFLR